MVPLERGPQDERICDKRIVNRGSPKEHWQRKTWQTLSIHYGSAPFWKLYEPRSRRTCIRGRGIG